MSLKDWAYQDGREHAYTNGISNEDLLEWLEEEETDQDGLVAWSVRGMLDQRSGVVANDQGMLFSYE